MRLKLGENRVAVTVQAPNGAAVRTYMITAYLLTDGVLGPSLASLDVSHGKLEPAFSPSGFKYSVVVQNHVKSISVTAEAAVPAPVMVCLVNADKVDAKTLQRAWAGKARSKPLPRHCSMLRGRGSSPAISLRVGVNLVEIEVLPADGTSTVLYELLVFRNGPAPPPAPPSEGEQPELLPPPPPLDPNATQPPPPTPPPSPLPPQSPEAAGNTSIFSFFLFFFFMSFNAHDL